MSAQKKLVRARFQEAVFTRDGHKCKFCAQTKDLDAHHITDRNEMPGGGYVASNGITLCPDHHLAAEVWHISDNTQYEPGMHPDDLYAKIGSSLEKAIEDSYRILLQMGIKAAKEAVQGRGLQLHPKIAAMRLAKEAAKVASLESERDDKPYM